MTENQDQIVRSYSPDKLLVSFTKSRFSMYLLAAVAIHVVFIAATSVGYINDRWIDPEGAALRKAEQKAAQTNQEAAAMTAQPEASVSNIVSGVISSTATPKTVKSQALSARTNTVIMKQITETAKPADIPKTPDDLGISLQDTRLQ